MTNKKRDINGYEKHLGRYKLNRSDLLAIEKILRVYADAREMKYSGIETMPEGQSHMPRKFVDRYVSIGRYRPFHFTLGWNELTINSEGVDWIYYEDSVKFLSRHRYLKRTRYIELAAWPGIKVTFTPLSTTVYAQTQYVAGKELKVMKKVVRSIEDYLLKIPSSYMNNVKF